MPIVRFRISVSPSVCMFVFLRDNPKRLKSESQKFVLAISLRHHDMAIILGPKIARTGNWVDLDAVSAV